MQCGLKQCYTHSALSWKEKSLDQSVVEIIDKYLFNQEQDYKKTYIFFIILAVIFIISTISNFFIQFFINKQILKNETKKMKFEKKIITIDELYKKLNEIKMNSIVSISEDSLKLIKEINCWISENKLNLTNGIFNISKTILDYFIEIYTNPERKDIKKEKKLFEKFIQEYEFL